jgi:hypothetical protein
MISDSEHKVRPSSDIRELTTSALLKGLADDTRTLLAQEVKALNVNLAHQLDLWKQGLAFTVVGGSAVVLGGFVLALGFVYVLQASFGWPLWASYSVVGLFFIGIGTVVVVVGKNKAMRAADELTDVAQQPIQDVLWIKDRKSKTS